MIIEIALGIALAVYILIIIPRYLCGSVIIGLFLFVPGSIGFLSYAFWFNFDQAAIIVGIVVCIFVVYLCSLGHSLIIEKFPMLEPLFTGSEPYNKISKLPLRIAVLTSFTIIIVIMVIGSLGGLIYMADFLDVR